MQRRSEQTRHALRNRQAQPQSLSARCTAAPKFVEDHALFFRRNTRPCVPHLQAQAVAASPHTQQYTTTLGITQGIGQKVLQHATQQLRIGVYPGLAADDIEANATLLGKHAKFRC